MKRSKTCLAYVISRSVCWGVGQGWGWWGGMNMGVMGCVGGSAGNGCQWSVTGMWI